MGELTSFSDQTGTMSQEEINAANIDNIVEELNRNSDDLDNFSNSLNVQNNGSISINATNYTGSPPEAVVSLDYNANSLPTVTSTVLYAGAYYPLPFYQYDNSTGAIVGRITQGFISVTSTSFAIIFDSFWYDTSNPALTIFYNLYSLTNAQSS